MLAHRPRFLALLLLAALWLAATGCATRDGSVRAEGDSAGRSTSDAWIGHTEEDIVAVFGKPDRRVAAPAGGLILYVKRLTPEDEDEDDTLRDRVMRMNHEAKFWVNSEGKIYQVWVDPVAGAKHFRPPPE